MSNKCLHEDGGGARVKAGALLCSGTWTLPHVEAIRRQIDALTHEPITVIDGSGISALDTAGAWLLAQAARHVEPSERPVVIRGLDENQTALFEFVRDKAALLAETPAKRRIGILPALGRNVVFRMVQSVSTLAFVGETAVTASRLTLRPWQFPVKAVLANIQRVGFDALPIVGLLSFLMGVVIAYQGGVLLRVYGAQVFVADLVVLSMLRELAPLLTAIIVAGRTGSSYAAQIGTMKVTEEIDAMRSLGLPPMERLILPKVVALVISLPLLTVFADLTGVMGGMFMAGTMFGIGSAGFIERASESADLTTYLIGIGKTPVFAAIIATVGCFQGLLVKGGAEGVGRQTTISVVQSIFLVIVVDAAFSVVLSWLGI